MLPNLPVTPADPNEPTSIAGEINSGPRFRIQDMHRICIVGVGLIGGSFGLAIRRHRPNLDICGFDRPEVLEPALERSAITRAESALPEAVRDADLVLLAAPVEESIRLMAELAPHVSGDTIVTDACSVKAPLRDAARRHLPDPRRYIGGHPMAGSERAGIRHADEFLFENAAYVLCPPEDTSAKEFKSRFGDLLSLVELTGARVLLMDAEKHDRIAARISHLPQLLAVALVNSVGRGLETDPELLLLSAGGFRDMTRIASSSFAMWKEILDRNAEWIGPALDDFSQEVHELCNLLGRKDLSGIEEHFRSADGTRTAIPEKSKGFLTPVWDLYVFVADQPGALHEVTGLLAEVNVSIKDIELLKIREGTGGTFRIGFESRLSADTAEDRLSASGYRVHRL